MGPHRLAVRQARSLEASRQRRLVSRLAEGLRLPTRADLRQGFLRLRVEPLEERTPLATFVVSNTHDSGPGSLPQAILDANDAPGVDVIQFNIPGSGVQTIAPLSALPAITGPVTIDGTTQSGYAGTPLIELNGSSAGSGANGLRITAANSVIKGLVINGFGGHGILITGPAATGNKVQGNYIGTNASGTSSVRNSLEGVRIENGAKNNIIGTNRDGTSDAAERNVISGNSGIGVLITGTGTDNNIVAGNYIGTNAAGTAAIAGQFHGVLISGGAKNNRIGTNGDGTADVAERNVISGNDFGIFAFSVGVLITGAGTDHNIVAGNYIGTDSAGTAAIPNSGNGVLIDGAARDNRVGTNGDGVADAAERNVISGNTSHGVLITGAGTEQNIVAGNYIGTDAAGTAAVPNGVSPFPGSGDAVEISGGARNNRIGTNGDGRADAAERNVISGNSKTGVVIAGTGTDNNIVAGNYIGTDSAGTAAIANGVDGIEVSGGAKNNRIGTNGDGTADTAERNVISGNRGGGVYITGVGTDNNIVAGNYVGINAAGTGSVPNGTSGVVISNGARNNRLGTNGDGVADAAERNVISANTEYGVWISAAHASIVAGNYIGTDAAGSAARPNALSGVRIEDGATNNRVGSNGDGTADAAEGNQILFNYDDGVRIEGNATVGNSIRGNAIDQNTGLGIDLGGDGVTFNDPVDADSGPNGLQNFPVVSRVVAGTTTHVTGTLSSAANTIYILDFYANPVADPSGHGEGLRWLGFTTVTTDGSGNASFDVVLSGASAAGEWITATATDPAGNTSEFSGTTRPNPWHNARPGHALDVTGDANLGPIDALTIINFLNAGAPGTGTNGSVPPAAPLGPPFYDVTDDKFVGPIDALTVINALNAGLGGPLPEGEGEGEGGGEPLVDRFFARLASFAAKTGPAPQGASTPVAAAGHDDLSALLATLTGNAAEGQVRRRRR